MSEFTLIRLRKIYSMLAARFEDLQEVANATINDYCSGKITARVARLEYQGISARIELLAGRLVKLHKAYPEYNPASVFELCANTDNILSFFRN